jgi:hypothetical protein
MLTVDACAKTEAGLLPFGACAMDGPAYLRSDVQDRPGRQFRLDACCEV